MADLQNCPNCGKLFVKALRHVCDACAREVETKFDRVYRFIRKRENRQASMDEVNEGTGVEKDLIVQFIREGRLHLARFPNLSYPCEKCGANIREGRLCTSCRDDIHAGLKSLEKESAYQERQKKKEQARYQTYNTLDDRVKRKQ